MKKQIERSQTAIEYLLLTGASVVFVIIVTLATRDVVWPAGEDLEGRTGNIASAQVSFGATREVIVPTEVIIIPPDCIPGEICAGPNNYCKSEAGENYACSGWRCDASSQCTQQTYDTCDLCIDQVLNTTCPDGYVLWAACPRTCSNSCTNGACDTGCALPSCEADCRPVPCAPGSPCNGPNYCYVNVTGTFACSGYQCSLTNQCTIKTNMECDYCRKDFTNTTCPVGWSLTNPCSTSCSDTCTGGACDDSCTPPACAATCAPCVSGSDCQGPSNYCYVNATGTFTCSSYTCSATNLCTIQDRKVCDSCGVTTFTNSSCPAGYLLESSCTTRCDKGCAGNGVCTACTPGECEAVCVPPQVCEPGDPCDGPGYCEVNATGNFACSGYLCSPIGQCTIKKPDYCDFCRAQYTNTTCPAGWILQSACTTTCSDSCSAGDCSTGCTPPRCNAQCIPTPVCNPGDPCAGPNYCYTNATGNFACSDYTCSSIGQCTIKDNDNCNYCRTTFTNTTCPVGWNLDSSCTTSCSDTCTGGICDTSCSPPNCNAVCSRPPTCVNTCGITINSPGYYQLCSDVSTSSSTIPCVTILSRDVEFNCNNFKMTGPLNDVGHGIKVYQASTNVDIHNCDIRRFGTPLNISFSGGGGTVTFRDSSVIDSTQIHVLYGKNTIIRNNALALIHGILIDSTNNPEASNRQILDNSVSVSGQYGGKGALLLKGEDYDLIRGNTFTEYMASTKSNSWLIRLESSKRNNIENNVLFNWRSHPGIFLLNSDYNLINQNTLRDAQSLGDTFAQTLMNSKYNTISRNAFQNLITSTVLDLSSSSSYNNVFQNTFSSVSGLGIHASGSAFDSFHLNTLAGSDLPTNEAGIRFTSMSDSNATSNVISNFEAGVQIWGVNSIRILFRENNVTGATYGAYVNSGNNDVNIANNRLGGSVCANYICGAAKACAACPASPFTAGTCGQMRVTGNTLNRCRLP